MNNPYPYLHFFFNLHFKTFFLSRVCRDVVIARGAGLDNRTEESTAASGRKSAARRFLLKLQRDRLQNITS